LVFHSRKAQTNGTRSGKKKYARKRYVGDGDLEKIQGKAYENFCGTFTRANVWGDEKGKET